MILISSKETTIAIFGHNAPMVEGGDYRYFFRNASWFDGGDYR